MAVDQTAHVGLAERKIGRVRKLGHAVLEFLVHLAPKLIDLLQPDPLLIGRLAEGVALGHDQVDGQSGHFRALTARFFQPLDKVAELLELLFELGRALGRIDQEHESVGAATRVAAAGLPLDGARLGQLILSH